MEFCLFYSKVREVGIEGIKISEANYPENLRKTIIINGEYWLSQLAVQGTLRR